MSWSLTFPSALRFSFVVAYWYFSNTQLSRRLDSNARATREEVDVLRSALDSVPRLVDVQVSPAAPNPLMFMYVEHK